MHFNAALRESHQALANHFLQLAAAREPLPVFAIEHNLDTSTIAEMKAAVSRQLEFDPDLASAGWSYSHLPLIVIASEVGYRYRGTGTDFWPIFAREVDADLAIVSRSELSRLFALAHQRFGIARPGDSPWELHFPHIAWAIGNAVVPLEIQASLADALRKAVRAGISSDNNESLLEYMRSVAAGHGSRRFESWLHQSELSVEVMRRLLDLNAGGWLSDSIIRRIDRDLRRDAQSGRAIREARRVSVRRSARLPEIPPSRFVLSLAGESPTQLLVRGPVISSDLRDEVIAALRIQGDVLRVAGMREGVSLRFFLAGGEIALGQVSAWPNSPLRRGDEAEAPSAAAGNLLEMLQPEEAEFFRLEPGERTAVALLPGDVIEADWQVLRALRVDEQGVPVLQRLDAFVNRDADLLRKNGYGIRDGRLAPKLLGLPMSGMPGQFAAGFPVLATSGYDGKLPVLNDTVHSTGRLRLASWDWAIFRPAAGTHVIGPEGAEDVERIHLQVLEAPDVEPAEITVHPRDATLTDLLDGTLEIRIKAPLALEAVAIRLRLTALGEPDIVSDGILERLPTYIAGRAPLLQALRTELTERRVVLQRAARLVVEARGFVPVRVTLRPAHRPFRFDRLSLNWTSEVDEGEKPVGSMTATLSAPFPSATAGFTQSDTTLLLPDSDSPAALASGLVVGGPKTIRPGEIEQTQVPFPRLLREPASRDGQLGLAEVARALLAWRLAEVLGPIADWQRRHVVNRLEAAVVEQLCGRCWQCVEAGVDLSLLSPYGAFRRSAEELGLLSGRDLPVVTQPHDIQFLRRRITTRLEEAVPNLSDALSEWDEQLGGDLDLAVIDAYEDLRSHLIAAGREPFEEVDMSRRPEAWRNALERAREMPLLPMFRQFILPEARWTALMSNPYEILTEDELIDLLDACHVDARRRSGPRWIGRAELRTMLQFWTSPRALLDADDWLGLLAKSLSDVQTARAVRYVALRRKLSRLDLPGEIAA
ncbi:hypothetical protein ABIA14_002741 [Sinorhizobium fredii]|uniref:hypothetical protein n=1 Tax=Rhizobium fredii TaxID=380 RepID=UPI0035146437